MTDEKENLSIAMQLLKDYADGCKRDAKSARLNAKASQESREMLNEWAMRAFVIKEEVDRLKKTVDGVFDELIYLKENFLM